MLEQHSGKVAAVQMRAGQNGGRSPRALSAHAPCLTAAGIAPRRFLRLWGSPTSRHEGYHRTFWGHRESRPSSAMPPVRIQKRHHAACVLKHIGPATDDSDRIDPVTVSGRKTLHVGATISPVTGISRKALQVKAASSYLTRLDAAWVLNHVSPVTDIGAHISRSRTSAGKLTR